MEGLKHDLVIHQQRLPAGGSSASSSSYSTLDFRHGFAPTFLKKTVQKKEFACAKLRTRWYIELHERQRPRSGVLGR